MCRDLHFGEFSQIRPDYSILYFFFKFTSRRTGVCHANERRLALAYRRMTGDTLEERRARYRRIARDSRYQHFVRIGPRIVRCLDHLRIEFDRMRVSELLQAYYLFIGVIDEALDSGSLSLGDKILEQFDRPASESLERTDSSNVEFMTEVLRNCVCDENRSSISAGLAELYC